MPRPRRQIPRATGGQGRTLDGITAWELAVWRGLDVAGLGLESPADFETAWREHGESILQDYAAVMPGSRPFGLYVIGRIPAPPLIVEPYQHDMGRRIGERVFHDGRCYGHADAAELEHLVGLGLVDADEEHAARRRIAEHGIRQRYQHQPAALDAPAAD